MATNYIVKPGDCISSIAFEHGFFPDTIWNHPNNKQLKEKREDPNTLCAGDAVFVPDLREKTVKRPTSQLHRFQLKNAPALCSLQMFDEDEFRANQDYELEIDGVKHTGKTDSEGVLRVSILPNARRGKLIIGPDKAEFDLQFGQVEPPTEIRGVQARLHNLGYDCPQTGALDEKTQNALRNFQFAGNLKETGEIDNATLRKLDELHDSICDIPNRDEVQANGADQSDTEIENPFEKDETAPENENEEKSRVQAQDEKFKDNESETESDENESEEEIKQ